jgi:hypothetical protein
VALKSFRAASLPLVLATFASLSSCSTAPKRTTPELSKLEGRKIALVEVIGEASARRIVEVALINQLMKRGTFELVSKQDVDAARAKPDTEPQDWKAIAREAGAEVAMRLRVLDFDATTREGYSTVEVEDSQLEKERGAEGRKSKRLFKVKSLTGKVRVEVEMAEVAGSAQDVRKAVAENEESVTEESLKTVAHLPPKLRFLEKISNEAFRDFFDRYN